MRKNFRTAALLLALIMTALSMAPAAHALQTPVDLSGIDNVLDFRDISALVLFLSGN